MLFPAILLASSGCAGFISFMGKVPTWALQVVVGALQVVVVVVFFVFCYYLVSRAFSVKNVRGNNRVRPPK